MILNGMVDLSYLRVTDRVGVAGCGGADPSCLRVTSRGGGAGSGGGDPSCLRVADRGGGAGSGAGAGCGLVVGLYCEPSIVLLQPVMLMKETTLNCNTKPHPYSAACHADEGSICFRSAWQAVVGRPFVPQGDRQWWG